MKPAVEDMLRKATKEQLTDALLSACQELAVQLEEYDMLYGDGEKYIAAGSLNNQVLKHLKYPDTVVGG